MGQSRVRGEVRAFACQQCRHLVYFDNARCLHCGSALGFLPEPREVVVVEPVGGAIFATPLADAARRWWRCLNASWGCNWMVPVDGDSMWCASCRLTRVRPDTSDPAAVQALMDTEAAKRLLVFELGELGLPVVERSVDAPEGLAFDLVFAPGAPARTGHQGGLITINLQEADDAYREHLRHDLGESYRTMLGHLRHEIGHHYWPGLVERAGRIDEFRAVFGDERDDYGDAITQHYQGTPTTGWIDEHVSAYASVHPWEDWAETFAHYIHIRDTLQTASAFGIRTTDPVVDGRPVPIGAQPPPEDLAAAEFDAILAAWLPLTYALNAVNRSMGHRDFYPFMLPPQAVLKLRFVHEVVTRR
jgi:hypothetical protein